jgi:hypothetical protein
LQDPAALFFHDYFPCLYCPYKESSKPIDVLAQHRNPEVTIKADEDGTDIAGSPVAVLQQSRKTG